MELVFDKLSKSYGKTIALKEFSGKLTPGVYGLLGANGAGKTTLMRLSAGIISPTSGRVLWEGRDIRLLGESYRDVLGYLPQKFGYYPEFSARRFLLYIAALKGIPSAVAKARCEELLEQVGLGDRMGDRIRTFSGGMKQRLGIAQAILNDPKVLILDEPTAGLDPKERVRFRNLISTLARDRIVLLSTHIVTDVEAIAREILVLKGGELLMRGREEALLTAMSGRVWEITLPADEAQKLPAGVTVVNNAPAEQGIVLRLLAGECPFPGAKSVSPTLEDLYVWHFSDQKEDRS